MTKPKKFAETLSQRMTAAADSSRFAVIVRLRDVDVATLETDVEAVDAVLLRDGGRRLSEPDVFHSVRVEATPRSVLAMDDLEAVESILENQPLTRLIGTSRRR